MCSDKTNKHKLHREFHNDYKPVIIASDIKHIALSTDCIDTVEHIFYVGKRPPLGRTDFFHPIL